MFHGSLPQSLRAVIAEILTDWGDDEVYVGCSGNLTIERTAHTRGVSCHANDVTGYTTALGQWFADRRVPFELKDEWAERFPWLADHVTTDLDTLATIMLGSQFSRQIRGTTPFHRRMEKVWSEQFPTVHAQTVAKLESNPLRLASYTPEDVATWIESVPQDKPALMFPPFQAGDYAHQFKFVDEMFDWDAPAYEELDAEGKSKLVEKVVDRPRWLLGLNYKVEELEPYLAARVQTTDRGIPIYTYASTSVRRLVRKRPDPGLLKTAKIGPRDDITGPLEVRPIPQPSFEAMRSQFMSKTIKPGLAMLGSYAVYAGGKVIGAFAYSSPASPQNHSVDTLYLLSDFPVSWTKYRRLSKLIVLAALSEEAHTFAAQAAKRTFQSAYTTAFSNNPQSSKYGRGIPGSKLAKRGDGTDGVHKYMLNYRLPIRQWTLAEALELWDKKHAWDLKEEAE